MSRSALIAAALERDNDRKPVLSEVTFTLPMPPSVNNLFINVPGRGRVAAPHYQAWKKNAAAAWQAQRITGRFPGKVRVSLLVERVRGDLDNRAKACLDLCVAVGLISDDRHIEAVDLAWSDSVTGVQTSVRAA